MQGQESTDSAARGYRLFRLDSRISPMSTLWLLLVPLVILPAAVVWASRLPAHLREATPGPWCGGCGYSLHGHAAAPDRCPECGADLYRTGVVDSRSEFAGGLRRRVWKWTVALLVGFGLFYLFLLPGVYYPGFDSHCRYMPDVDNANDMVVRDYAIFVPRAQWILGPGIPIWLQEGPITLMVRSWTGLSPNTVTSQVVIEPHTMGYSYTRVNGKSVTEDQGFESGVILAWLADTGLAVDSEQIRNETVFLAEYIRSCCEEQVFHPATQPMGDIRIHYPVRSETVYHPAVVLVPTLVLALLIWSLVTLRIRRRTVIVTDRVLRSGPSKTDA
jgi:hypothetical protein